MLAKICSVALTMTQPTGMPMSAPTIEAMAPYAAPSRTKPENRMPGNWCDNRNFASNRTGAEWAKGCCVFDRQYTAAIETCIYRFRRKGTSATTPLGLSTNNHVLPKLLPFAFSWISKRKSRNTAFTPPLLGRFLQEDIEIRKKSPNFIFYRDFGWFGSIVRLNRVFALLRVLAASR